MADNQEFSENSMAGVAKRAKRAVKRVTMAWRHGLIDHSPEWLRRRLGPHATYMDMLFIDHGIFRLLYLNMHRLSEEAWRSAQPAPHNFRRFKRMGIKTVVNLRGERVCGSFWHERKECKELGLNLVNFTIRSRAAPSREDILAAREMFQSIEYPMVMHCKSGADRAGLMSVLYQHVRAEQPIDEALRELSLRYGHIRQADTGILDVFFERYLADTAERPMPFFEWVEHVYDSKELTETYKANGWANRLVDVILRRE